jgi:hypothetical protein
METQMKRWMIIINVLGGAAVLGSYALGILGHADPGPALWGGVPETLQPLYTAGMLTAALGYFAFTGYLLLGVDAREARVGGRFGFGIFNWLYIGILVPSAMWMPLTFLMVEQPSTWLWLIIRVVLAVVGLSSLGLLAALLLLRPGRRGWAYWLAVAGTVGFSIQTAILDALVWTAYFM